APAASRPKGTRTNPRGDPINAAATAVNKSSETPVTALGTQREAGGVRLGSRWGCAMVMSRQPSRGRIDPLGGTGILPVPNQLHGLEAGATQRVAVGCEAGWTLGWRADARRAGRVGLRAELGRRLPRLREPDGEAGAPARRVVGGEPPLLLLEDF